MLYYKIYLNQLPSQFIKSTNTPIAILPIFTTKTMATKVNIPILGITRNTDDGISKDGECMELINARLKDGSIEPIGKPIQLAYFDKQYKAAYYHSMTDKYLFIRSSDGSVDVLSSDFKTSYILSSDVSEVKRIEFVGYMVCLLKEDHIVYCIYDNGEYKYLGKHPEMPTLKIGQTYDSSLIVTESQYYQRGISSLSPEGYDPSLDLGKVGYGFFDECISTLNRKGYFIDRTLIRYAFRLYDGSYIMHSPIYLVQNDGSLDVVFKYDSSSSRKEDFWQNITLKKGTFTYSQKYVTESKLYDYYEFGLMGFYPTLTFSDLNLEGWKNLIVSIDVFATRSIMDYELKETGLGRQKAESMSGQSGKYYNYTAKDAFTIGKDIAKEYQFYKIAEYDLKGNLVNRIDNVSDDSLSLENVLSDDENTHTLNTSECSYVYNSRLHLGNVKSKFYEGYPSDYLYPAGSASTNVIKASISTYIASTNGTVIVKREFGSEFPYPNITSFLIYPDNRAYKMVICVTISSGTVRKEFALAAHKYLNLAYYINYTTTTTDGRTRSVASTDISNNDISTWEAGIDDTIEQNIYEIRPQILKVSALNNPLYFPSKTTYTPSNHEIIAICSNTTALSQGQFGQHPLYVFCKDGIYAMSVGTEVVYTASSPVCRDVCNNPDSVKGLDSEVTFATDRGLMLISGTEVKNISIPMDGYLPSCIGSSPIIPKIMKIAGLDSCVSTSIFSDYCGGAKIGYNYQEREIVVSNPDYTYSYVYCFKSDTWCKVSKKVNSFINTYPDILALTDSAQEDKSVTTSVWNLQNSHRSIADICLITRPIKMGTNTHKRILQSALRGIVKRSLSDLYLRGEPVMYRNEGVGLFSDVGLYILGSNDAEHFSLIVGKERMVDIRDLVTKINKSKPFKYFMVTLVGGVRTDVALNYIECIVDESYNNRLR